jgi:hypothetical protein
MDIVRAEWECRGGEDYGSSGTQLPGKAFGRKEKIVRSGGRAASENAVE